MPSLLPSQQSYLFYSPGMNSPAGSSEMGGSMYGICSPSQKPVFEARTVNVWVVWAHLYSILVEPGTEPTRSFQLLIGSNWATARAQQNGHGGEGAASAANTEPDGIIQSRQELARILGWSKAYFGSYPRKVQILSVTQVIALSIQE